MTDAIASPIEFLLDHRPATVAAAVPVRRDVRHSHSRASRSASAANRPPGREHHLTLQTLELSPFTAPKFGAPLREQGLAMTAEHLEHALLDLFRLVGIDSYRRRRIDRY